MVTFRFESLQFDRLVEFIADRTIFASAHESGTHHRKIFLISEATGSVYARKNDRWEQMDGSSRDTIIARLIHAKNSHVPVYRLAGKSEELLQ